MGPFWIWYNLEITSRNIIISSYTTKIYNFNSLKFGIDIYVVLTLEYFGSLQPTTARIKTTIRKIGEMKPQHIFQKKDGSLPIINAISLLTFLNP